jgi:DNA-binding CsgD family transcriptional regulator
LGGYCHGQQKAIDSLDVIANDSAKAGRMRIEAMIRLSNLYAEVDKRQAGVYSDPLQRARSLFAMTSIKLAFQEHEADITGLLFEALSAAKESEDNDLIIAVYNGLANYYLNGIRFGSIYRRQYAPKQDDPELLVLSLDAFKQSFALYLENKDRVNVMDLLEHLISLYTYKTRENSQGETHYIYPDSIAYYSNLMLEKAKETNNIDYQAMAYAFLFGLETNIKEFKKAEDVLNTGMNLIKDKEGHLKAKYMLIRSYVDLYEMQGDYEKAFEYQSIASGQLRKIYNEQNARQRQIAEARFKIEENEKKLLLKQEENKLFFWIVGAIGILLMSIVAVYYMRLRNAKLKIELEKEKAERQALEINRLQKEVIVGSAQLEYKNEILETISKSLDKKVLPDNNEIKRLLDGEKKMDEQFDDYVAYIKNIHPGFYDRLQEKASQKLTALDIKYCTYIFMNLSSKDIASMLFVEPSTVRTTKYRLKQKLTLGKEDDLESFIRNSIK